MFPDDVYRYVADVTRTPLGTVLTAYYGGDNTYDNARGMIIQVAIIKGDITEDNTEGFSAFIDQTALSLNLVVAGGSDYVWKV